MRVKASSANEILRSVLGIESTIPIWAEDEIRAIIGQLGSADLGPVELTRLSDQLGRLGIGDQLPTALQMWLARRQ